MELPSIHKITSFQFLSGKLTEERRDLGLALPSPVPGACFPTWWQGALTNPGFYRLGMKLVGEEMGIIKPEMSGTSRLRDAGVLDICGQNIIRQRRPG